MDEYCHLKNAPTIPKFYSGKTIFITGGTGFMGKVLIEKLLYSCPDLDRIYLLMRTKKGVRPEDRIAKLYSPPIFDRLRREKPGIFQEKIFVIAGDVMEIGLGISDEDRALLINRVNIVFHVAASVRFTDPLKDAVFMNLRGSREVIYLAREMRNLVAYLHTSTSYSNQNWDPIEEKMYPPLADWRKTIEIAETVDGFTLKILTPKYIDPMPNTYTFTKQLAEHVVNEEKGRLPVVIFRPSIVVSTLIEPMPGWNENFNGPVGIIVASGKGIIRSLYFNPNIEADYMPVDIAIKCMIAAAWERGVRPLQPTDEVKIYNCCAGNLIRVSIKEVVESGKKLNQDVPLNNAIWHISGDLITENKLKHYLIVLFLHLLPAIFIDLILRLLGMKPLLVKLQRRIYIANIALEPYVTQQWNFTNQNFIKLRKNLKEEDLEEFYYNIEKLEVYPYFRDCSFGARRYLLNEPDDTLEGAHKHSKRMFWIDLFLKLVVGCYLLWKIIHMTSVQSYLSSCVHLLKNIWNEAF